MIVSLPIQLPEGRLVPMEPWVDDMADLGRSGDRPEDRCQRDRCGREHEHVGWGVLHDMVSLSVDDLCMFDTNVAAMFP